MVVQSDFYVVKNVQLLEQTNVLEGTRDSILIDLDRTASGDILSIEKNGTGIRLVHTRQQVEYRRLSCSIRSDQTVELSFLDRHAEIIDCFQSAEGNADIFYL